MTISLAPPCGVYKIGTLTKCAECGYHPPADDNLSIWLSEWSADEKTMNTVSGYIQELRETNHDPEVIRAKVIDKFTKD
jgi:hypothetical protein